MRIFAVQAVHVRYHFLEPLCNGTLFLFRERLEVHEGGEVVDAYTVVFALAAALTLGHLRGSILTYGWREVLQMRNT